MEIKPSTSIRLCRKRIARTSLPMGLALNRGDKGALVATPAEFIALNNQGEVVARLDGGGAWTCRPTPAGDHVVSSVLHDDGSLIRIHDLAQSTVAEAWSFSDVAIADGFGSQNSNQVLMIAADGSNNGWYHELSILDSSRVPPDAVDVEAGVCEPELAEFADELREAEEPVPVILAEELGTRLFAASICSVLVLEPGQNLRVLAGSMPYGGEADEEDESAPMELRHATATDQLLVLSRKDSILAADVYTLCENQPAVLQLSFGLDSLENDEEWVERGGPMPRLGVDSGARWIAYACGKSLACFGLNTSAKIVYEFEQDVDTLAFLSDGNLLITAGARLVIVQPGTSHGVELVADAPICGWVLAGQQRLLVFSADGSVTVARLESSQPLRPASAGRFMEPTLGSLGTT